MAIVSHRGNLAAACVLFLAGLVGQACGTAKSGFGDAGPGPTMDAGIDATDAGHDTGMLQLFEAGKDAVVEAAGPPVCDPSCEEAGGTCSLGNCTISENPGAVSPGTQGVLKAGGSGDASYKWL